MTFWSIVPIAIVAAIATFAAIHELHFIMTNNMRKIVTLVYVLVVTSCWAQEQINDSTRQNYGACIMHDGSISGINENERFAMHSVMKFPQALYVADYLSRKGLALDDTIVVDKADLMQDTWSPMLKRFEGKMALNFIRACSRSAELMQASLSSRLLAAFSYAELLELSLGQSDNNACELLFKHCGKPKAVEKYMRKLGFRDIHVRMTEKQMHKNPVEAIKNSSTPAEMVRLFEWFYHHKDDNQYLAFIWKAMADCSTGLKRIPAAIPADARIVHKTGTGFPSPEGVQDMNDAGIILMPDGRYAIIAVFITHSPSETVIANIARQLIQQKLKIIR
jgi:beta-lactamase class A